MKVLMLLSKEFLLDPRVYREATSLAENGYDVYVAMWDKEGKEDIEKEKGVNVVRISAKNMAVWLRKVYKKSLEMGKFDIIHSHDLETLPVGVILKKKMGAKLIYDAHEIFSYMLHGKFLNILSNTAKLMDTCLTKSVDYIITANEPMIEYFKKFTDKPIMGLINCLDPPIPEYTPPENDMFTLCYYGLMQRNRFFPDIVELIGEELKDVKLILASRKEGMYDEIEKISRKYENVEFLGTISMQEVINKTLEADATFVFANPKHIKMKNNIFGKQLEALACGRPIICTKGTWSGDFTEKNKCGITAEYNRESIKEAILKLKDDERLREKLGRNALKLAKEKYNWQTQKKNLLKVYDALKL